VHGKTAARHTSEEFVAFLEQVVEQFPPSQEIHIILDNLSAHKTKLVQSFLATHSNVRFHFTPPTPPGSIELKSGSPGSNVTSSLAASSPLY
jgi:hypothetical protein